MSSVDVVIPCYQYGRYLTQCVNSVLTQEGVSVRILIINDASSDNTDEIGRHLSSLDSRVEYRCHHVNQGHIATYNEGLLEWANTDYCLLLSADDALSPGSLRRAISLLDVNPKVSFVYGMAMYTAEQLAWQADWSQTLEHTVVSGKDFIKHCFASGSAVSTPTAVVRSSAQKMVGGYSPELPHTGDMEMWIRLAARGPVGVINSVQAYYRLHDCNMSLPYRKEYLRNLQEERRAFELIANRLKSEFPEMPVWLGLMAKRVGAEAFWLGNRAFDVGDMALFRSAMQFAEYCDPRLKSSAAWWRLRLKLMVGPRLWRSLIPWVDRSRGRQRRAARHDWTPPVGQQFGWWPGFRSSVSGAHDR